MSKHTPGPWRVVDSWNDYMVESQNGEEIIWQDGPHNTPTINKANARLIAAAPDLLQAWTTGSEINTPDFMDWIADRLVNVYGENPNIDFVQSLRYRAKLARAAIAKAKGEV